MLTYITTPMRCPGRKEPRLCKEVHSVGVRHRHSRLTRISLLFIYLFISIYIERSPSFVYTKNAIVTNTILYFSRLLYNKLYFSPFTGQ